LRGIARSSRGRSALSEPARVSRRPGPDTLDSTCRVLLPLAIAALTFLAFLPVLDAGFLSWDDETNLVNNAGYRGLGWAQLRWMFTTTLLGHYIPLTWMTFGLNYLLGGMNPRGYHLTNLLLHAANAALFYVVARRLLAAAFDRGIAASGADHGHAGLDIRLSVGAAFAALIFGVHPLRVESVAWVTERRDVVCGLFYLLATLAYLRGVRHGGKIEARWRALSLGAFVLALLSKASALPLPAALLLLDVFPLRRVEAVGWRRLVVEKIPYLALSVASALLAVIAQSRAQALTGYREYGIGARLAMTAYNLVFYPWKLVWPADLSPLYELPPRVDPLSWRFLAPALALVVVTIALVALRRRWPGALAAWVYSGLLVLPVTGAVAHAGAQLAADRYSYLSGLGFAVLAGGALTWLLRGRDRFKPSVIVAVVLAAALVIVGWAASAWRQSKVWHDSETLWRWAVDADPDCAVCYVNLGAELVTTVSGDPARAREAEARFRRALALDPRRDFAYHGLGVALASQHRDAEAEAAFLEYTRREPNSAIGFIDLAQLYRSRRRDDEALPFLRRAFALEPDFPGVGPTLARVLRERGEELRREGRDGEAGAFLAEAAAVESSVRDHAVPAHRPGRPGSTMR
jgi:tetratricopeptide (TPR) repeat protein